MTLYSQPLRCSAVINLLSLVSTSRNAVRNGRIYEVKSAYILQPGPAALTEGVRQLHEILAKPRL